ncbi:MAG: T9SS type A sorting domain-containing protein, partial [Candidatus Cloacimonetes bacterium]|nr:T9SS type A sorting domain-containing protein [Candidatus Cloacimonadota bacterium]
AYPNPFNPNTTIKYYLKSGSFVCLDIYNIKGQKVKSLVNEYKKEGSHQVSWNGLDDSGVAVSSGVYFYRLKTEDNTSVKRMMLMK